MNLIHAIILGAIQGLAEFIPISSSAHLIFIPWLFNWKQPQEDIKLLFDVSLHLGTLVALVAYFWREWYDVIKGHFSRRTIDITSVNEEYPSLIWPIAFACMPAAITGLFLEKTAEKVFDNPMLIGISMIALGVVLFFADKLGRKSRPMNKITPMDWMIIGFAQALALIPGVSRSGITMTAGLLCGLEREAAARFSFLLSAPLIFGAFMWEFRKIFTIGLHSHDIPYFVTGIITAAVIGYLCIGFLLKYLKKRGMGIFVGYRIVVGTGLILMYFLRR